MSSSYDPTSTPTGAPGGPGPSFEPVGGSFYGSSSQTPPAPQATPPAYTPTPAAPPTPASAADPYATSGAPTSADPRGAVSDPYGQPASAYGQPASPYGQSTNPYGQPASLYGQPSNPYGQPATPYGHPANLYGQPPAPYGQGGDIYGVYGYPAPTKSKAAAALLAFFLGSLGIHNFYLGQMGRGFAHLALLVGGWAGLISAGVAASNNPGSEDTFILLLMLFYLLPVANGIWAFIEFIIILIKPEHELGR